jgi:hypothetical protein
MLKLTKKTPLATSSNLLKLGDACTCGCRRGDHYLVQVGFPACSTCDACRGFELAGEAPATTPPGGEPP